MKVKVTLFQGTVFSTGSSAPSMSRLKEQAAAVQTRILSSKLILKTSITGNKRNIFGFQLKICLRVLPLQRS
jgi:hypothetical protein